MRVGDNLFDDRIAPGWVRMGTAVTQNVVRQTFQRGLEIALFVVKEALAVGDQILKVANLWPVHRRIVDFGDDTVPKGKPHPAGSCIGGSYSIRSEERRVG